MSWQISDMITISLELGEKKKKTRVKALKYYSSEVSTSISTFMLLFLLRGHIHRYRKTFTDNTEQ